MRARCAARSAQPAECAWTGASDVIIWPAPWVQRCSRASSIWVGPCATNHRVPSISGRTASAPFAATFSWRPRATECCMKLYEFAFTRSIRARWTLQELGVDFEGVTVNMRAGEHRSSQFLAINPAGKLPALVDGDLVLTESAAIVWYLAEKYRK